jgi:hypothetical protein
MEPSTSFNSSSSFNFIPFQQIENKRKSVKESTKVTCSDCGIVLVNQKRLEIHSHLHDPIIKCECFLCQRKFSYTLKLIDHLFVHAYPNELQCKICNAEFKLPRNLKTHTKVYHKN